MSNRYPIIGALAAAYASLFSQKDALQKASDQNGPMMAANFPKMFLMGLFSQLTRRSNVGVLSLILLFIVGAVVLTRVKDQEKAP